MGRRPKNEGTSQTIDRLRARIWKLEADNTRDLQEMAERGKDMVKLASILRGCKDVMEESVYEKLMDTVIGFETRCYITRRTRKKKD